MTSLTKVCVTLYYKFWTANNMLPDKETLTSMRKSSTLVPLYISCACFQKLKVTKRPRLLFFADALKYLKKVTEQRFPQKNANASVMQGEGQFFRKTILHTSCKETT